MAKTVYMTPERVDRSNSSVVQEDLNKLMDEGATNLVIDMVNTTYVSSACLRVFLAIQKRLGGNGNLALSNVRDSVKDVLDVTGFSGFIQIK